MMTANFIEMTGHIDINRCCGGGVISKEDAKTLHLLAFNAKNSQLAGNGVETMSTACSICRHMVEDGSEINEMRIELVGIIELISDNLTELKPLPPILN